MLQIKKPSSKVIVKGASKQDIQSVLPWLVPWLLKGFDLYHSVIKTKHLRSLIRNVIQGFEWLKIVLMSNLKFKYWLNSIDQWITGSMSNLRNPSWWFLRWKGLTRLTVSAMTPPALQKNIWVKIISGWGIFLLFWLTSN